MAKQLTVSSGTSSFSSLKGGSSDDRIDRVRKHGVVKSRAE
jgi:hypothetical protein